MVKRVHKIENTLSWNEFIKTGKKNSYVEAPYLSDRSAIVVYSSGTTGASKGIQLTNYSINSTIRDYSPEMFPFCRGDRCFTQIPIWFSTGIVVSCMVPLAHGVSCILEPIYDFVIFQKEIEKYRPHLLVTPSVFIEHMMVNGGLSDEAVRNFKYLCVGGDYIAPQREKSAREWLLNKGNTVGLHKAYGMCECGGTVTTSSYSCNDFGAAGIPTAHVTVAAFDLLTGTELKYGERGELRVDTPCRMKGYFKKPEETQKYIKLDDKGTAWACTGDMGYVSEDGSVFVCGRISDSYVNKEGDIIFLFDIERAVLDVPEVRQCKAVASEINEEKIHVCHVVLDCQSSRDAVLPMIYSHCVEILPHNHIPTLFRLYDDALPIALSGKLDTEKMRLDMENLVVYSDMQEKGEI